MAGAQMLAEPEKKESQAPPTERASNGLNHGAKNTVPKRIVTNTKIEKIEKNVFDRLASERQIRQQEIATVGSAVSSIIKIPVIGWIVSGINFLVNAVRNIKRQIEEKNDNAAAIANGIAATVYNSTAGAMVNLYYSILGRALERKRKGEEIEDNEYAERLRKIERHIFDNNFSTALAELERVGERKLAPERAAKIADLTDEVKYIRACRSVFNIFFGIPKKAAEKAIAEKVKESAARLEELSSKASLTEDEKNERAYLVAYLKRKVRPDALYVLDLRSREHALAALGKQALLT